MERAISAESQTMWWTTPEQVFLVVLAILAHSVAGLVAIWAALGSAHWFVRVGVVGAVLALGLPIPAYDLMLIFLAQSVVVMVPLLVVRYVRAGPARDAREVTEGKDASRYARPQFSLLDLLLATVVIAAMVAFAVNVPANVWEAWGLNVLFPFFKRPGFASGVWWGLPADPPALWIVFGSLAVFFGVSTLAAAWVTLGKRLLWMRSVLLLLIPTAAIMAAWLALVRASRYSGRERGGGNHATSEMSRDSRRRLLAARLAAVALVLLSLAILLPLAGVYCTIVRPAPIPHIASPNPNGYADLVQAGKAFEPALPLMVDEAPEAELRAFVTQNRRFFEKVRIGLDRECLVPFLSDPDHGIERALDHLIERGDAVRAVMRALEAEGRLAEMEGRTADAIHSYFDMLRLGRAAKRGGVLIDWEVGWAIQGVGVSGLIRLRASLTPDQCRELLDSLQPINSEREPLDDVLRRGWIWAEHVLGWQGRLRRMLYRITGEAERQRQGFGEFAYLSDAKMQLLMCDLALRVYGWEHSSRPQKLTDLVPEYLATLPHDPFTGKPPIYRPTSTGYLLYSVGYDRVDDGGRAWDYAMPARGDIVLDEPSENEEEKRD
jgi:hypothetical protein